MAVPPLLSGLMDTHGDTLQQAALLVYLKQGDSQYLEVNAQSSIYQWVNVNKM